MIKDDGKRKRSDLRQQIQIDDNFYGYCNEFLEMMEESGTVWNGPFGKFTIAKTSDRIKAKNILWAVPNIKQCQKEGNLKNHKLQLCWTQKQLNHLNGNGPPPLCRGRRTLAYLYVVWPIWGWLYWQNPTLTQYLKCTSASDHSKTH